VELIVSMFGLTDSRSALALSIAPGSSLLSE